MPETQHYTQPLVRTLQPETSQEFIASVRHAQEAIVWIQVHLGHQVFVPMHRLLAVEVLEHPDQTSRRRQVVLQHTDRMKQSLARQLVAKCKLDFGQIEVVLRSSDRNCIDPDPVDVVDSSVKAQHQLRLQHTH